MRHTENILKNTIARCIPFSLRIYISLVTMALLVACDKTLDAPVIPPLEVSPLAASTSSFIVDSGSPGTEAVIFTWEGETNNSQLEYNLIFTAGSKDDTVTITNAISKAFTYGEINPILLVGLGLEIGVSTDIEVVLQKRVKFNNKFVLSNPVLLNVTAGPDAPPFERLWIVGNATPNGWNINTPNEMVKDPTNAFQFKYNAVLNAGEFKIPTTTGNWGTDFYMPPVNHPPLTSTDVVLTPGGNPDNKWEITEGGPYKILLNISPSPFIEIKKFTPYENVYIVGDATPAGWNIDAPVVMVQEETSPWIFTWTGELKSSGEGAFKFPTEAGNWGGPFFMAPVANAPLTTTTYMLAPTGSPDNKYKVKAGEEGTYKITINQLEETISIVKQ